MAAVSERAKLVKSWHAVFRKGTDFDSWGQLVEAVDEYSLYGPHSGTKHAGSCVSQITCFSDW